MLQFRIRSSVRCRNPTLGDLDLAAHMPPRLVVETNHAAIGIDQQGSPAHVLERIEHSLSSCHVVPFFTIRLVMNTGKSHVPGFCMGSFPSRGLLAPANLLLRSDRVFLLMGRELFGLPMGAYWPNVWRGASAGKTDCDSGFRWGEAESLPQDVFRRFARVGGIYQHHDSLRVLRRAASRFCK